ncbi:acetate kinase, partial [Bacillus toyonensis]|nr:acetate kinase [Bacillus toyonensis]
QLLDVEAARSLASGLVERIGEPQGLAAHTVTVDDQEETFVEELAIPDHAAGFTAMLDAFVAHGPSLERNEPLAVGHRVVHGGARYFAPTPITPEVEQGIDDLSVLAPLHNPGALQGVRAAKEAFPALPHVAVFDTAFHQTLPPEAYTYA